MPDICFSCVSSGKTEKRPVSVDQVVIAGWTGRDRVKVEAHIQELEELGIPGPATTPVFYQVAHSLLTTGPTIQVAGNAGTGEVECVTLQLHDGLWVGLGSDHTDRELEKTSVTFAKQACAKPIADTLWRYDDIADGWDGLEIRSYVTVNGTRRLYQQGSVCEMLPPLQLIEKYNGADLDVGTAMFCGTLPVIGEFEFSDCFEMELHNPVAGNSINHSYRVQVLPVSG